MPDAVLLDAAAVDAIRAALNEAPARCRIHGDDFGRGAGWERGLPRCESCQGPYCVQRALSLLSSARRVAASPEGFARPNVKGRCPNCGHLTLFLADGGHVTCSSADCDDPGMADDLLGFAQRWGNRIRLVRAEGTSAPPSTPSDSTGPPILRDLVDPGDAHRAVVATFTEHDVANDDQAIAWWATRAVLDLQTTHCCARPSLITGPEAANHPVGTRLVSLDSEGRPRLPAGVFEVDRHTHRTTFAHEVRFLAFPPPPPALKPVVHRFPPDWSSGEPFALACCGRAPDEVEQRDQMAFYDDLVTCPGAPPSADESGPDPARAASKAKTAPTHPGGSS